jgi:cyclase
MLKTRIIPVMLWKDSTLVKGQAFNSERRTGTILPTLKVYNRRQVDELMIMDITATTDNRKPDFEAISDFADECFVPLTIGGGIKTIEDIAGLLMAGADKVAINSATYEDKEFIKKAATKFGSQCIVVSIDAKKNDKGDYECYSHCGQTSQGIKPNEWAKEMQNMGAGEILITSIPNDGMMEGYDLDLIKSVTDAATIPIIAAGGASNYKDLYEAISTANASAVAAASIFHFTEQTPLEAKQYLADKGISVRDVHKFKS